MRRAPWLACSIALIAVVGVAWPGSIAAQPARRGDAPGTPAPHPDDRGNARAPDEPRGPPSTGERRERLKKRIRAMRAYQLTEELALDEQTAGKLFPLLSRYDDEIDRLLEKRIEVHRRLQRASTLRDARAIERVIDDAVANQRGFRDLEDRRLAELRKILTPGQTARILIVLPSLERRIENQLRRAIVQRLPPGQPPAGSSAGSFDDDDDDPEADRSGPPPRQKRNAALRRR
jgi:hypothetical protein